MPSQDEVIAANEFLDSISVVGDGDARKGVHGSAGEVGTSHCLGQVQQSRIPVRTEAAPVVQSESDVARLLNLREQDAFPDRVHGSRRDKYTIARTRWKAMETFFHGARFEMPRQKRPRSIEGFNPQ